VSVNAIGKSERMGGARGKCLCETLPLARERDQIENNRRSAVPEIGRGGDAGHPHQGIDERPNHGFLLTEDSIEQKSDGLSRSPDDQGARLGRLTLALEAQHGPEGIERQRFSPSLDDSHRA
jgi:hypothetical protein